MQSHVLAPAHDLVLFDLDGTISDPSLGICRCLNYALEQSGFAPIPLSAVGAYIGPPLDESFRALTGIRSHDDLKAMVATFRERYGAIGFSENELYPGVVESLEVLLEAGVPMGICTSKRVDFAERILAMFGIRSLFRFVNGGEIGVHKWEQVAALRAQKLVTEASVIIGDRAIDIIAGHRNGLTAAGVLWGHGSRQELENEQPRHLLGHPSELADALIGKWPREPRPSVPQ